MIMALISAHTPEPMLPVEHYRTEQNWSRHGGYPILDRRLAFPVEDDRATVLRITFEPGIQEEESDAFLESISYATSEEAKAEMLVQHDPDCHMLLGFWPGRDRSDVFILTNVDHYLRELGYTPESEHEMTDKDGRKWAKR